MVRLILFGAPGAGKGTQAELLAKQFSIPHISTGDMLRAAIGQGTALGNEAQRYVESGGLVPDDVVIGIVREAIAEPRCHNGFILDGFPRTIAQAQGLQTIFDALHYDDAVVISIEAGEEELVKRLLGRGRADDTVETIRRRLRVYADETAPVKDFYVRRGNLREINGEDSIETVQRRILDALTSVSPTVEQE